MQAPRTALSSTPGTKHVQVQLAMPDPYNPSSPATRRRRSRRRHLLLSPFSGAARTSPSAASSSASSPASSAGGLSLFSLSRSPSPFHHLFLLSPLHAAASAVPFAWEHRPGVPKTPAHQSSGASKAPPLPLPPSRLLLSGSKIGAHDHPFTIAKDADADDRFLVPKKGGKKERLATSVRRQPALAAATLTDCLAVLSLCRSCSTRSSDCLAGTRAKARKAKAGWSG